MSAWTETSAEPWRALPDASWCRDGASIRDGTDGVGGRQGGRGKPPGLPVEVLVLWPLPEMTCEMKYPDTWGQRVKRGERERR